MAQGVKNLPAMQETQVRSLGREDPLEKGVATHSSILAWRIPGTEEPDQLQSAGLQRVEHDWSDWTCRQVSAPGTTLVIKYHGFWWCHFLTMLVWGWRTGRRERRPPSHMMIRSESVNPRHIVKKQSWMEVPFSNQCPKPHCFTEPRKELPTDFRE